MVGKKKEWGRKKRNDKKNDGGDESLKKGRKGKIRSLGEKMMKKGDRISIGWNMKICMIRKKIKIK